MNNYLHGLPFHAGADSMSDCSCPGQAFDPAKFKLYSEADRLPTFVLRLPVIGDNPDLSYANECVRVFSCDGNQIASVTMSEGDIKLFKDDASYYITYDGSAIPTIKLECGKCYRLKISSFWSEVFWVTNTPQEKVQIEFSNKSQLGDVPYQTPVNFVQRIMIDAEICSMDAELFESRESQANGVEEITYQRLTSRKALYVYNAPDFIQQLLGAIKVHDQFKVIHKAETLIPLQKRTSIDAAKNGCCDYDITLTMPLRDISIIGGACQSDSAGSLEEVDIPDDLPDACEVDGDWTATEESLCLPFNQFPPVILPPIPPVGTPPVGAPCPPAGQIVGSNTLAVNCSMAFEHEGVLYRKKVTKQIADGSCGTTTEIQYVEPCTSDSATHTISNITCEGDVIPTPPVGTPPVGTPPVGTPPVGTPPVGTPPVGTPPVGTPGTYVQKYRLIMGTTGGGFSASATHGIEDDWVQRIEACHYPWGWGITGISLWISWHAYEPTPGNFQTAALQRAIAFCNDRQLELSITWLPKRSEGDGFLNSNELVKGSAGTVYLEGVPGFGGIYASYGNDRVNALMVPAIQSIANTLKTYSRSFYMAQAGGHTGEFINHIIVKDGIWESGDFSDENLSRFNTWCTTRGLASPGTPPMIQGAGIPWPYPNFGDQRGLEFGRFMTYNLSKHYRNFCNAVKSVAPNIPCINLYAAADNLQLRATANAAMGYIGQWGDGMYGSEGDGVYDHIAKFRVNSVNLGTFPNGISCVEFDPDDTSTWRYSYGTTPPYGNANPQWAIVKSSMESLMNKGCMVVHWAMAFSPSELASDGCSQMLQQLFQTHFGKAYNRPTINSTNRVNCEVTGPYRNSQNILDFYGVDPNVKYANYTNLDYWGGVPPEGSGGPPPVGTPPVGTPPVGTPPPVSKPAIDNYVNTNAASYQNNIVMDVIQAGVATYSYRLGAYTPETMLPVASLCKVVSAAVLLTLIDDGILSPTTTVGSLIPSWNSGWQAGITLRQIISHTAGISPDLTETLDGRATLAQYVDDYAAFPMDYTPGTQFKYSTHPYNVAARMAEVATGLSWKQLFEARIRNKCGMGDAIYNPKDPYQPISGNPNQPNAGHGLWVTQGAFLNFMKMIMNNGNYGGVQVISTTNLPMLWTDQTAGLGDWGWGMIRSDGNTIVSNESAVSPFSWYDRTKGLIGVLFAQAQNSATIGASRGLPALVRANF